MKKIDFVNNDAPYLSAENLNQMQDNIEEAIEEHYSTEETFTGKYWIDGKKIYKKVIITTAGTLQNLLNSMSIETVIYKEGMANAGYDTTWFINDYPSDEQNNYKFGIRRKTSTGQFVVSYGSNYSDSSSLYLILEYTKTTD